MLSTVRLSIANKLKNRLYRRKFFRSETQDDVAQQLRALRAKRQMRQADLAKQCKMKQSAISRVEQANYSRWSFPTLLRIADALDARVKITLQPAEDVIKIYEDMERQAGEIATHFEAINEAVTSVQGPQQMAIAQRPIPGIDSVLLRNALLRIARSGQQAGTTGSPLQGEANIEVTQLP